MRWSCAAYNGTHRFFPVSALYTEAARFVRFPPSLRPDLQGEPMPVVKRAGDAVSAGTVNCDGSLTVSVERAGEATAVADIVRAVESAQARAAPVQRLADTISGHFCYGVMAASAATFGFWATAGAQLRGTPPTHPPTQVSVSAACDA